MRMMRSFARSWGTSTTSTGDSNELEQEYYAILQALQRIEALLIEERGKREFLERSLQDLKQHVAALQARIEDLERRL